MSFMHRIKVLLGLDFEDFARQQVREDEELAARKGAGRYSRGSVNIQKQAFETRGDLNARLERFWIEPRKEDDSSPP